MATVVKNSTVHRKRSKKSHEKHRTAKRKKGDDSDEYHVKKHTKQNKIRNLSQLAKLIQTGKLQVPHSLIHYVTDHTSLIDQIFTILTADDIEGMLPDILKGVKLRKVKQLCFNQLQLISPEQLKRIITGEQGYDDKDTIVCDVNESISEALICVGEGMTLTSDVRVNSDQGGVTLANSIPVSSEGEGVIMTSDACVNSEGEDETEDRQDMTLSREEGNESDSSNSEEISPVMEISDISDNEYETRSHRLLTHPLIQVGVSAEDHIQLNDDQFEYDNMKVKEKLTDDIPKKEIEHVPESSHIIEIQLRKRLLEAQLRRLDRKELIQDTKQETSLSSISDPGLLMELQLRQRALESLIIKRQ